jgi:membrane associated rhomboid family serine protease
LPQYITVGASGGIFGLIGACISGEYLAKILLVLTSGDSL